MTLRSAPAIRLFIRRVALGSLFLLGTLLVVAQDARQLPADHLLNAHPRYLAPAPRGTHGAGMAASGIPGIDSLANWNGSFQVLGFSPTGKLQNNWLYNMVGKPPQRGGTTSINAPVVPVVVQLLDPNGKVLFTYDPRPFVVPTLLSPSSKTPPTPAAMCPPSLWTPSSAPNSGTPWRPTGTPCSTQV